MSRNLIITGLMGSGKSTVGQMVAQSLSRHFVDTDHYIESHYGSPSRILNQPDGDELFRKTEEAVAKNLAAYSSLVIATGGRFMVNQRNIDVMVGSGDVVCLDADLADLVDRLLAAQVEGAATYRPRFAKAANKLSLMRELQRQSQPFFGQFDKIQTSGSTPAETATSVINWYRAIQHSTGH